MYIKKFDEWVNESIVASTEAVVSEPKTITRPVDLIEESTSEEFKTFADFAKSTCKKELTKEDVDTLEKLTPKDKAGIMSALKLLIDECHPYLHTQTDVSKLSAKDKEIREYIYDGYFKRLIEAHKDIFTIEPKKA